MAGTVAPGTEETTSLLCRAGAVLCAIPLGYVVETMRPLPIEPLPGTPPFVRGLSVIRGVPTPVVDASLLLGETPSAAPGRFVTMEVGERPVALAVESVIGVRALSALTFAELPPLARAAAAGVVAAISTLDAELLLVLEAARLLPDGALPDGAGAGAL